MLKHLLFLFLFSFLQLLVIGQDYLPFPDSNAIWVNHHVNYEIQDPNPFPVYTSEFYTKYCAPGLDTLIDSLTYTQIFYCGGDYKGALRDEMGKVYFIPTDSINELLLYDFTLELSEEVSVYSEAFENEWFEDVLTAYGVDSVLVNGLYRKRIYFSGSEWIEGIGNTFGLFNESWINVSNYFNSLSCMSVNDTSIYPNVIPGSCALNVSVNEYLSKSNSLLIFPNPTQGYVTIEFENSLTISEIDLVNMMGKEVNLDYTKTENRISLDLTLFPKGMYILQVQSDSGIITNKIILE